MKRFLLIPLFTILVGCGVKPPIQARNDPYADDQVNVASAILRDNTAVRPPVATRDETGNILYVTIPIRSTSNQQMYVDYRATFFDRNGQALTNYGWMTKTLTPNVPDSIVIKSGDPRAADFHVDLRDAK